MRGGGAAPPFFPILFPSRPWTMAGVHQGVMDIVNGTLGTVRLSDNRVLPGNGGVAQGVQFGGVLLHGDSGTPVDLGAVERLLREGRTWAAPKGDADAFFQVVQVASNTPAVLYTTSRTIGPSAGLYVHGGMNLQYFSPAPGAMVPAGFEPLTAPTTSHGTVAHLTAGYDPRLEATFPSASTPPCQTTPVQLYSLERLFGPGGPSQPNPLALRLAQGQGDLPPLQLRRKGSMYGGAGNPGYSLVADNIAFSAAAAAVHPEGFASLAGCEPYTSLRASTLAEAAGMTALVGPPRPQDLIPTQSSFGQAQREFPTHPRAAMPRPLSFGQAALNLTPENETAKCRAEAVKRINHLVDAYATLRMASKTL